MLNRIVSIRLLPGTPKPTSLKWMEMMISNHFPCKDLVLHPIETTIKKTVV